MEEHVKEAIIEELQRQAEIASDLEVRLDGDRVIVRGPLDLDALAMRVVSSLAGAP